MKSIWQRLPVSLRRAVATLAKLSVTVAVFYVLLTHRVTVDGDTTTVWQAIQSHAQTVDLGVLLPFVALAAGIKLIGIVCSMTRWHLLLRGQGIAFNFWHIVGSFLIGRFLGTFLPSTVGLDGYKLYDAARHSGRVVEPAAATAVEKVMGLSGVLMTFLVMLPFGYAVLPEAHARTIVLVTVPIAGGVVGGLFLALFQPAVIQWGLGLLPFKAGKLHAFVERVSTAAAAYRGKGGLLASVIGLSFLVHFLTAAMYYFTALGVGAAHARFGEVAFASSIQIFATVISPFTIAGEGVRELVQALLLTKQIGATHSILSAALGFWAAEALTLVGGFFWLARRSGYTPRVVRVETASTAELAYAQPRVA